MEFVSDIQEKLFQVVMREHEGDPPIHMAQLTKVILHGLAPVKPRGNRYLCPLVVNSPKSLGEIQSEAIFKAMEFKKNPAGLWDLAWVGWSNELEI
tara:strand:+ start:679 stop:966 length:288 start_codon:yes stop_codon:yes gene_type:complete